MKKQRKREVYSCLIRDKRPVSVSAMSHKLPVQIYFCKYPKI
jgi:hypothetical protein